MSIGVDDEYNSGPSIQDDVQEVEDEYSYGQSIQDNNDSNELDWDSFEGRVDGALRLEYNNEELRQLKAAHVKVPTVPNFMGIILDDQAICDTSLTML